MSARLWSRLVWLDDRIPLVTLVVYCAALVLIAPWGNFPVNDDWQYARAALKLWQTGHFIVDTKIAPAIVGQTYFVQPFIWLFGFSHTVLRCTTLVLSLLLLWAIDRLLALAGAGRWARRLTTLLVAFNPLFVNLSASYMTELHSYTPALWAAYFWFRARRDRDGDEPAISYLAAALVGIAIGGCFWTRQFVATVYPALVGATLLELALARRWRAFVRTLPPVAVGVALFALTIRAYFWWARATGNLTEAFASPLAQAESFDGTAWTIECGVVVVYLTAFMLPLVALFVRRLGTQRAAIIALVVGGVLVAFVARSISVLQTVATEPVGFLTPTHRVFPFIGNIIFNAGLGPMTLHTLWSARSMPKWPLRAAQALQIVLMGCSLLWGAVLVHTTAGVRARTPAPRREIVLFGALLTIGTIAATVQAYGLFAFDRYYLACLFGLALVLGSVVREPRGGGIALFSLLLLPLAFYSVAGEHDYFRWNEVRWQLGDGLLKRGISPMVIDGGFEWSGWNDWDGWTAGCHTTECIGPCRKNWFSTCDDSYRIDVAPPYDGYRIIDRRSVALWLVPDFTMITSVRPQ